MSRGKVTNYPDGRPPLAIRKENRLKRLGRGHFRQNPKDPEIAGVLNLVEI